MCEVRFQSKCKNWISWQLLIPVYLGELKYFSVWGFYLPAAPWPLRVYERLIWEWSLVLPLCLGLSPPGQKFPAAVPNVDGLTCIYQCPHVHKQLIFLSVSLIYFACYLLVYIYHWHSLRIFHLPHGLVHMPCSGLQRHLPMAALFQPGELKRKLSCAQLIPNPPVGLFHFHLIQTVTLYI